MLFMRKNEKEEQKNTNPKLIIVENAKSINR